MRGFHTVRQFFTALGSAIVKRLSGPEFTCGDCERWERCGRPPTAECAVKLAQIERDPTGYQRRMKARSAFLKSGYWA
jgi:hypothetical protein